MSGEAAERFVVLGRVQGVGYRWWAVETARRLGLRGWVRNRRDGSVEIHAAGAGAALGEFARACEGGPASARVSEVRRFPAADDGLHGFEQRPTE
jgi:acylphosphatase